MNQGSESTLPLALTFILPTRNRRGVVIRAIESCLAVDTPPHCRVEMLILDGNSTDGSYEELQAKYGNDARVQLVRQTGERGFMPACFMAVPMVKTPFVTFMYDDDVLSPHWKDLPLELKRRGGDFIMGFSKDGPMEEVVAFERVTSLLGVSPALLIRAYFGYGRQLSSHVLPFSPVCCLTRTDWLNAWMEQLKEFTGGHPMRQYFMMTRNAGPDLMIYLSSILECKSDITLLDGPVAQFSTHADSITSELEHTDLTMGYWLGHVWLCEQLRKRKRHAEGGACAAYTVKQGVRLALKRIRRRRFKWLGSLLGEIFGLFFATLTGGEFLCFFRELFHLVSPRQYRPQFFSAIRREARSC